MKKMMVCCCMFFLLSVTTKAQTPDSAEMMKKWMEYMTPGKEHKMMESWNGTWEGDIKMWMAPATPPIESKGTSVNNTVLGGRYQHSTYKGSFSGMPMEGMSILAYDNARKVFLLTWIDNFGTGVMNLSGPWDAKTKTMTLTGNMVDPMSGKDAPVKEIFYIKDDDTQVMEMYTTGPDGKEFKTMEIVYKRKK